MFLVDMEPDGNVLYLNCGVCLKPIVVSYDAASAGLVRNEKLKDACECFQMMSNHKFRYNKWAKLYRGKMVVVSQPALRWVLQLAPVEDQVQTMVEAKIRRNSLVPALGEEMVTPTVENILVITFKINYLIILHKVHGKLPSLK